MTNLEYAVKYYPYKIIDLLVNTGKELAVDVSSNDGKEKICECSDISCCDCKFNRSDRSCADLGEEWLREEHEETIANSDDTSDDEEGGISW